MFGVVEDGVHIATLEVDAGPILAQAPVAIKPTDTVTTLHERIKIVERKLYVDTLRDILESEEFL